MKKVAFYTLGCKLNYSETSTISRMFEEKGYKKVDFSDTPDIFIINTCSVTENADKKCRKVVREARSKKIETQIKFLPPFYRDADFVSASAEMVKPYMDGADHLLFSFHGLPERQIKKMDESGSHCLRNSCCDVISSRNEKRCYRAQSFETARLIARSLNLAPATFSVSFQSRLNQKWIQPFTDDVLPELAKKGVKTLVVACPSFTTDCLETLEEIGMRAREQFIEAGGRELRLVPCLNSSDVWVEALAKMILRM